MKAEQVMRKTGASTRSQGSFALLKGVQPAVVRAWNRREWRAGE